MIVPPQTAEIFKILSKGLFISSNSSDKNIKTLYNIIEEEDNFDILSQYFQSIDFILNKGHHYFYFSRPETKVDLENKIEAAFRWIDILDFFKTYDHAFTSGYRFQSSEILVKLKVDTELETKLEALKRYTEKENHADILDKVLKKLIDESFLELENPINQQYKVLDAFRYLEQIILTINIPEEIENEIPE